MSYYRLALPIEFMTNRFDAGGTWHALLTIGEPRFERSDTRDGTDQSIRYARVQPPPTDLAQAPARLARAQRASVLAAEDPAAGLREPSPQRGQERGLQTLPYSIVVHAYSNLTLEAQLHQTSFEPGSRMGLYASVAQSGIPLAQHAQVWAEVTGPAGATTRVDLPEVGDGRFAGEFDTTMVGVYRIRVRAKGTNLSGEAFTREQLLTGAVWRGGDQPTDPRTNNQIIIDYLRERDERLCALLECLLKGDGTVKPEFERRLREFGIDLDSAMRCLAEFCRGERS